MKQLNEKIIGWLKNKMGYALYFLSSIFVAILVYALLQTCMSYWASLVVATIISCIIVFGKDVIDKYIRKKPIDAIAQGCKFLGIIIFIVSCILSILNIKLPLFLR